MNPAPAVPPDFSWKERFQIGASLIPPIALGWMAARRGWLPLDPRGCLIAMPVAVGIGMLLPSVFAGWHRFFSRIQSAAGRRLLALLLRIVFLVAVLPVGLLMRWRGRSFLRAPGGDSYWQPAKPPGSLRNQF